MNQQENLIHINSGLLAALQQGAILINVFNKDLLALKCIVAGTSFRQLDAIEIDLLEGVSFGLKREPANEYDKHAVALYYDQHHVGYIPRQKNEVVARLMDAGKSFVAKVKEKDREGNWIKLKVEVYLQD